MQAWTEGRAGLSQLFMFSSAHMGSWRDEIRRMFILVQTVLGTKVLFIDNAWVVHITD